MCGDAMPTIGSCFSGVGMIDCAFERAGFDISWQIEIDLTARDVLARHWPNVPRFNDVRECGGRIRKAVKVELPRVDVIVGGFP